MTTTTLIGDANYTDRTACLTDARMEAAQYRVPAYVYQVSANRYAFRFGLHEPSAGVLIARFDANGRSF